MKIGVDHPRASKCAVYLDGKRITHLCFFADDEAGEAHCYIEDANGRLVMDPDIPYELKRVIRRGVVEIRFSDE